MSQKEKKVVRNIRLSFSEGFDRKLQATANDMMWNMLPLNVFIRHLVEVGLNQIVFEMELDRARAKARLAALGGECPIQRTDTGVKARIIPFRKQA